MEIIASLCTAGTFNIQTFPIDNLKLINKVFAGTNSFLNLSSKALSLIFSLVSFKYFSFLISPIETHGIVPLFQYSVIPLLGVFPNENCTISPNLTHSQLSGISNGFSLLVIAFRDLFFLIFFSLINFCFSNLIFSSNTVAGSSFESCSTNFPCIAKFKIFSLKALASKSNVLVFIVNSF